MIRPTDVVIQDPFVSKTLHNRPGPRPDIDSWAYTANQATTTIQDAMRELHHGAMNWLEQYKPSEVPLSWAESVRLEVKTKAPAVRVHCKLQAAAFMSSKDLMIEFPRLEEHRRAWLMYPDEDSIPLMNTEPRLYYHGDKFNLTDRLPQYLFDRGITSSSSLPLNVTEIFADLRRVLIIPQDI